MPQILNGVMKLRGQDEAESLTAQCKLCSSVTEPMMVQNGFRIVRCSDCGFMFAIVPPECDLRAVYTDDAYWN
ncbi:MAG TPA: hypothetical protein VJ728_02320, partial [Candidatus Binataceae bacterium]|nr:hypothetical protein [Candidatus Binataceae bacterium]